MSRSYSTKHVVLAVALALALIGLVTACFAISYVRSGTAAYWTGWDNDEKRLVTRQASPDEFAEVVRSTFEVSVCFFVFSAAGFVIYKKLDEAD